MIEKIKYQCELCGTEYANKKDAEACEKNHKVLKFNRAIYNPINMNNTGLPIKIEMVDNEGYVYVYKR